MSNDESTALVAAINRIADAPLAVFTRIACAMEERNRLMEVQNELSARLIAIVRQERQPASGMTADEVQAEMKKHAKKGGKSHEPDISPLVQEAESATK